MNNHTMYEGKISKVAWPLAIILGFVPLVMRLREIKLPEATKQIWDNGSGTYADFFSANKVIVLGIATLIGIVLFMIEYIKARPYKNTKLELQIYKNKTVYICLGVYTLFAVASTIMASSTEKSVAFFGAPGRYEGLITILFYILSMILAMHIGQEWWNVKFVYRFLIAGAFILGLIGVGQFLGVDIFQTDGGKALILPYEYLELAGQVSFNFNGRIYGTLFNPNYVGSYAAMLMPISIVGMIYTYTYKKDNGKKISATLFALIMIILWLACYSRGGLIGGGFALLLIFILLYKRIIKTKTQGVILITLIILPAIIFNILSKGVIAKQIFSLPKEAINLFTRDNSGLKQLEDVKLEQNAVEISSNLPLIRIEKEGEELILKDSLGNLVPTKEEGTNITPQDEAFQELLIVKKGPNEFMLRIKNPEKRATYYLDFVQTNEGMRIVGSGDQLQTIEPIEAWGFKGKEKLGSNRGYIWSRTLPMIKDTWLLGYGPDTYVLRFPQHDVIGKINSNATSKIIVDKPHNLYLQTIVSTGLPSLLALIVLFITYCILWVRHIRSTDKDDIRRWMSIGIFAALWGYLLAGLFNDSVVSVAPVFWVLWGLGIGLASTSTQPQIVKKVK